MYLYYGCFDLFNCVNFSHDPYCVVDIVLPSLYTLQIFTGWVKQLAI